MRRNWVGLLVIAREMVGARACPLGSVRANHNVRSDRKKNAREFSGFIFAAKIEKKKRRQSVILSLFNINTCVTTCSRVNQSICNRCILYAFPCSVSSTCSLSADYGNLPC